MIKIVFICSSLEPGRDGVGDYVRRLGSELIKRGYHITAIALNDIHISNKWDGYQDAEETPVHIIRLPAKWSATRRFKTAKYYIKTINPKWISLQYVSFGFQKKGVPLWLNLRLRILGRGCQWHIMFHELWVGMSDQTSLKQKLLGLVQKKIILLIYKSLQPKNVFTSIYFYHYELSKLEIKSSVVPIFGNIPTNKLVKKDVWEQFLTSTGISIPNNIYDWLVIGFFGTIYQIPDLEKVLTLVYKASQQLGRKPIVLSIGRNREVDISEIINKLKNFTYIKVGIHDAPIINNFLNLVDIGISTTPALGINKSGASIAWLERGIPILISSEDNTYNEVEFIPQGVWQATNIENIIACINCKKKFAIIDRLDNSIIKYINLFK